MWDSIDLNFTWMLEPTFSDSSFEIVLQEKLVPPCKVSSKLAFTGALVGLQLFLIRTVIIIIWNVHWLLQFKQLNKFKLWLLQIIDCYICQQMNWLPIRRNNIPIIDRQVNKALQIYRQIQQSIMQGDILAIQKMSEFQLSVKVRKRIHQMDQFYNKNCLDQRVRFLQASRMRLFKILSQNIITEKQSNVNLPWKNTSDINSSRKSNSSSRKITPRKNTSRNQFPNNEKQSNRNKRGSKSPINRPIKDQKKQEPQNEYRKKVNLSLQIPNQLNEEEFTLSNIQKNDQNNDKARKGKNTTRKMQHIPKNRNKGQTAEADIKKQQQNNKMKIVINQPNNQPQIKISEPPRVAAGSSRSKITNTSGKSRTMTEGSNTNSMRKLNDLIFTIKMTKEEYQDFVQVKKKLNNQGR